VLFKFRKGVKFEIDCRKTALLLLHYDMQNRITLRFGIIIQPTKGICLGGHCPPYKADSNIPLNQKMTIALFPDVPLVPVSAALNVACLVDQSFILTLKGPANDLGTYIFAIQVAQVSRLTAILKGLMLAVRLHQVFRPGFAFVLEMMNQAMITP
jgi:hypothetical protein